MAKKKKTTRRYWNVWIEGRRGTDCCKGRDKVEAACGSSCGSGYGDDWDVFYSGKTEKNARKIASKAAKLFITRSVRIYKDGGPDEYIKGSSK